MASGVSVSVAFKYPADESMMMTIAGGIRIEVGGVEVTKKVHQERYDRDDTAEEPPEAWWYDHTGQPLDADALDYKGGFSLYVTLSSFAKNVLEIARGSPDRFEQLTSDVGDTPECLVLSYLDGEHDLVRVAYQDIQRTVGTNLEPTVESTVGYAVPLPDLCAEVARCLTEYVTYADAHALDADSAGYCQRLTEIAAELEQFASGDEHQ